MAGEREGDGTVRQRLQESRQSFGISVWKPAGALLLNDEGDKRGSCRLRGGRKFLRTGGPRAENEPEPCGVGQCPADVPVQYRLQCRRCGHGRALPRELTGGNRSEQRFLAGEVLVRGVV